MPDIARSGELADLIERALAIDEDLYHDAFVRALAAAVTDKSEPVPGLSDATVTSLADVCEALSIELRLLLARH